MATDAERLTRLEAKAEWYDKILAQNAVALDKISCAFKQLVVLEERQQSLDRRHESLYVEFSKMREKQETRKDELDHILGAIHTATEINSKGRSMWEKMLLPVISGVSSGVIVGGILAFALGGAS